MKPKNILSLEEAAELIRIVPIERWDKTDIDENREESYYANVGYVDILVTKQHRGSRRPTSCISIHNYKLKNCQLLCHYSGSRNRVGIYNELDARFKQAYPKLKVTQTEDFLKEAGCSETLLKKMFQEEGWKII